MFKYLLIKMYVHNFKLVGNGFILDSSNFCYSISLEAESYINPVLFTAPLGF